MIHSCPCLSFINRIHKEQVLTIEVAGENGNIGMTSGKKLKYKCPGTQKHTQWKERKGTLTERIVSLSRLILLSSGRRLELSCCKSNKTKSNIQYE